MPDATTLSPIETRFAGCRFRSRLEARWAVFFDAASFLWEYEPEGFNTTAGPYLPDFWVQSENASWSAFVEIKPEVDSDLRKPMALALAGQPVAILRGSPEHPKSLAYPKYAFIHGNTVSAVNWVDYQGRIDLSTAEPLGRQWYTRERLSHDLRHCPLTKRAYGAARSARFEHGECGYGS